MIGKSNSERVEELEEIIRGLVEQVERLNKQVSSLSRPNKNDIDTTKVSPAAIGSRYDNLGDIVLRYKTGELVEGASPIPRYPQPDSGE